MKIQILLRKFLQTLQHSFSLLLLCLHFFLQLLNPALLLFVLTYVVIKLLPQFLISILELIEQFLSLLQILLKCYQSGKFAGIDLELLFELSDLTLLLRQLMFIALDILNHLLLLGVQPGYLIFEELLFLPIQHQLRIFRFYIEQLQLLFNLLLLYRQRLKL